MLLLNGRIYLCSRLNNSVSQYVDPIVIFVCYIIKLFEDFRSIKIQYFILMTYSVLEKAVSLKTKTLEEVLQERYLLKSLERMQI